MADDSGGAAGSAGGGEEKPGRSCMEDVLDFVACLGRGAVATGSGVKWTARYACYPIKESVVKCVDRSADYQHPYRKKEFNNLVPTFEVTTSDARLDELLHMRLAGLPLAGL
eukprot:CAMPEP_0183553978 /NCGR_PEP_ID=MMETSP0371-20130417/76663_1 /TAXON_ID=268820 /ORGANISM="Peridinium aciculiferum, Strain PAER-2" /LENGTH=111 /DNA_ID=CAMNT_0025759669 /DNA_START=54 /DNA_END=390 /DNA_ORIENTATION=+